MAKFLSHWLTKGTSQLGGMDVLSIYMRRDIAVLLYIYYCTTVEVLARKISEKMAAAKKKQLDKLKETLFKMLLLHRNTNLMSHLSAVMWRRLLVQKHPPEVFYKKGVLINLAKFTGKYLCQSLSFHKVADL